MRRYVSNLFLVLVASLFAVSCVNEMELSEPLFGDDAITLVPRVKSFANQYVTKAGTGESDIKSLTVLVFNNLGKYVYSETIPQGASLVLNKSLLAQGGAMDQATIVLIANASLSKFKTYSDSNGWESISERPNLAQFQDASFIYEDDQTVLTSLPDTGLPMIGLTKANLTPTENTGTIQVDLQILYAKVNFSISVANGGENEGTGMKFVMSGYTINNVAKVTPVKAPKDMVATAYADYAYTTSSAAGSASGTTTPAPDSNPVTFTFYVAETRYNPTTDLSGVYPSDSWLSTTLYDHLKQQYKPKVAIKDGEGVAPYVGYATYVTLKGSYTDYRGTVWTVNYQVYLGKDNATNFQVDRNSEYTNYVVIKGIRNNSQGGTNDVWVDHRVVVSTDDVAASYVNITRETLIDSHIEVRPLRVQWEEGKYYCVRLYLPTKSDGTLVDWIGVERFTGENCQGTSLYCYQNNKSIGKRKYFTQNLIAELQENEGEFGIQTDDKQRKYITLFNKECAWIYFDENTTEDDRPADIKLDFIAYDGSTTIKEYTYKVTQQGLSTVSIKNADNSESKLRYESYEEYLHSYDPIDQYDLSTSPYDYTKQGLEWGLNEVPLSSEYVVSAAPLDPLIGEIDFIKLGWMDDISSRYDYFHKNDAPSGNSYFTYTESEGNWGRLSCGTGLDFTERASSRANTKITVEDMATMPTSAYQYCLSKNKFKADEEGNVEMTVNWYLPDVYELQAVLTEIKKEAVPGDFVTDAFYWSSQPSRNSTTLANLPLIGQYLDDIDFAAEDNAKARAVSLSKDGTVTVQNTSRTTPNRIRCLYSPTGKPTDMEGRTPEGIGGKVTFVMKAYDGNQPAHFNDFLSQTTETTISNKTETTIVKGDEPYTNETFAWPTFNSDAAKLRDFGFFNDREDEDGHTITGFSENPADPTSWEKFLYLDQVTDSYTTLYNFPGLDTRTMKKDSRGNAYKPTDTPKSKKVTVADIKANRYSGEISGESRSLDGSINITFATHTLQENNSRFEYSAYVTGSKEQVTTSYWKVPIYEMVSLDENNPVSYSKTYVGTHKQYFDSIDDLAIIFEGIKPKALADAKRKAMDEYPGYIYSYGEPTYKTDNGTEWVKEGWIYIPKIYAQVTCTLSVSISNFYYQNPDGGGWDDEHAVTNTEWYTGVLHDELRMFSGNSFTISLSEEYKKTHEIVSVKVYYSGDNKMKSFTDGNLLDGIDNPYDIYARFVASNVELPSQQSTPPQLVGMDYNEESNGTGWQMWSGNGTATITMNLMDYVVTKPYVETGIGNLGDYAYLYRDIKTSGNDASNLTKHIVIDKIEIRCVPKSTTQSE